MLFRLCCRQSSTTKVIVYTILTAGKVCILYTPAEAALGWCKWAVSEHEIILWQFCCSSTGKQSFKYPQLDLTGHFFTIDYNIKESDLGTELLHGLLLLGPVPRAWGVPDAPVGYLGLQPPVGLLQPVHLFQEALQASIETPHCLTGVLQQVHGDLRGCTPRCLQTHTRCRWYFHSQMTNTAWSGTDGRNTQRTHNELLALCPMKQIRIVRTCNFHGKQFASHLKSQSVRGVC